MINDTLTIATALVSLLVIILVFGSIYYSHITTSRNMKTLARNSILMDADDEMRDLCKKIMSIDPNACPLLDGDTSKLIKADPEKLKLILKKHLSRLEKNN